MADTRYLSICLLRRARRNPHFDPPKLGDHPSTSQLIAPLYHSLLLQSASLVVVAVVVVVVVVLTLTYRYNAVRGHRTGCNNSGAEDYLRRKTKNRTYYTR